MIIIRANKKDIKIAINYKKKMAKAMTNFDIPVSFEEINFNKVEENLLKDLDNKDFYFLLLKNKDKYIGFINFSINKFPNLIVDKYMLNISSVFIDEEFRRKGFAETLSNYAIKIGKKHNCVQVELNVFEKNPAKFLYKKMGFSTLDLNMKYDLVSLQNIAP